MCQLFPRLTHLATDYHSRRNLRYLLNKLVHLEQLTLRLSQDQYAPSQSWVTQYTRLQRNSFELRVFNFANEERWLVLWISTNNNMEEKRHSLKKCSIR
ncbi:unnamed protein product [Rotaria sp. Silwood2]|nr:unnamed protein product [Rotaria sp. Silwood2]CAF3253532.1 unnamed protein product [Rotaria sp. Silwood2]CAF4466753.1 unnamed protein product [Rotaria sp. Silwood2]CAF4481968.1 unnamed protein product [Rotaria sp. Silwood2]